MQQRILIVVTSNGALGDTGRSTGFYLDEVAVPYYAFIDKGYAVDIASPAGGAAPADPGSLKAADDPSRPGGRFMADKSARTKISGTRKLSEVNPDEYAAMFIAGGHGVMWDLVADETLGQIVSSLDARGAVIAAVCHGPAGLVSARRADGSPVVSGRRMATFTDDEERAVGLDQVVPFLLESRLRELGADVVAAPLWADNAIRDDRLVTGQNPVSAGSTAALVLEALAK